VTWDAPDDGVGCRVVPLDCRVGTASLLAITWGAGFGLYSRDIQEPVA